MKEVEEEEEEEREGGRESAFEGGGRKGRKEGRTLRRHPMFEMREGEKEGEEGDRERRVIDGEGGGGGGGGGGEGSGDGGKGESEGGGEMTGGVTSTPSCAEVHTLRRTMVGSEEMKSPGRESMEEGKRR